MIQMIGILPMKWKEWTEPWKMSNLTSEENLWEIPAWRQDGSPSPCVAEGPMKEERPPSASMIWTSGKLNGVQLSLNIEILYSNMLLGHQWVFTVCKGRIVTKQAGMGHGHPRLAAEGMWQTDSGEEAKSPVAALQGISFLSVFCKKCMLTGRKNVAKVVRIIHNSLPQG